MIILLMDLKTSLFFTVSLKLNLVYFNLFFFLLDSLSLRGFFFRIFFLNIKGFLHVNKIVFKAGPFLLKTF